MLLYYLFAQHLPESASRFGGKIAKKIRYILCKNIFKKCGKNVNINRRAKFGNGYNIEIGDNSDLGINCSVPNNIIIGNDVMMAPNCFILPAMHNFGRTDIPMRAQGSYKAEPTIIEDDVEKCNCNGMYTYQGLS